MNHSSDVEYQPFIPQEVALLVVRGNIPLVKAWRIRLNMSVEEIATAAGMLPDDVAGFEKKENGYSYHLLNVARAMNLDIDQIVDISN